jgi:biofilm PGA synthesis N-glycosyltransferase PgaC
MIELLFWLSAAAITYTFIGYPVTIWLLARLRMRPVHKAAITPSVSVVLACHNEERNLERRIQNLLESDYPAELLEVIVVSDGSTDLTGEKASRLASSNRVHAIIYAEQRGKAVALNVGVAAASGNIIVFADARQTFERGAIRELAANFSDPRIGAASGELVLEGGGASLGEGVGLYWKYEKAIRKSESRFSSTIGATGAIYAIRRELWNPLPDGTILDDVFTPMSIALRGHRVVFDEKARAHDTASESSGREFSRKVRTLLGNYQLCQLMPTVLIPNRALSFQFYSHKLMRLAAPFFFLILLACNVVLVAQPMREARAFFYQTSLATQLAFYAAVLAGGYLLKRNRRIRVLNFAYVFSLMNAAALVGLIYFVFGKRNVWAREK